MTTATRGAAASCRRCRRRGAFLPPLPLPRRLWAGGRLRFLRPLRVGEAVRRESRVSAVESRVGRSGPLVFVTVQHEVRGPRGLALAGEHDIVYREAPRSGEAPPPPPPAPDGAQFGRDLVPDAVLLLRYSALTCNGHRIHDDRRWCEQVEGYPGLVVHGPLIATLLLDLLRREQPAAQLREFRFKALRPCFDGQRLALRGRADHLGHFQLWAQDHEGLLALRAGALAR